MLQVKSLLVYWASKGHNAIVIFAKMEGSFGVSAPSDPWVTKWLRALTRGEDIFEPSEPSGRPEDPVIGMKFINFLDLNPFASVRQIATATKIALDCVRSLKRMGPSNQACKVGSPRPYRGDAGVTCRAIAKAIAHVEVSRASRLATLLNR
jgi:hypothetical protein